MQGKGKESCTVAAKYVRSNDMPKINSALKNNLNNVPPLVGCDDPMLKKKAQELKTQNITN